MSTLENISRDILGKIQQSYCQQEILVTLQSVASQFGFEYFTYTRIFPKAITRLGMIAIGNYPEKWLEQYKNKEYIFVDPVIKHCTSTTLPYYWKNIFTSKDNEVKKFAKACSGFGLKDGFTIGINGNCGDFSLWSLGGNESTITQAKDFSQAVMTVHIILPYLHDKLAQINPVSTLYPTNNHHYPNTPLQELTVREKECLLWTAGGKTAYEIAAILKISESTINFHLKNAAIKLDCVNKTHAVAKAVLLGLNLNMPE